MEVIDRIGTNIRKLRESLGITQEEFGRLIGKSGSQVGAYENEKTEMPVSVVYAIAEQTGCSIEWLMTGRNTALSSSKYDVSMRIYNLEDRLRVIQILAKNGYDVGQHKEQRGPKAVEYYVHAKEVAGNADTSRQGGSKLGEE